MYRRPLQTPSLVVLLVLALGAPAAAAPDHFFFYKIKPTRGAAKFVKIGPVTLDDQFRAAAYSVVKPVTLGLPANKNAEGVGDAATHLLEYQVKPMRGVDRFEKQANVRIANQCSELLVEVKKPVSLLVPASKGLTSPLPVPDPQTHDLDHFLCYAVALVRKAPDGSKLPPFPKGVQVVVADQFETRRYDLKKITKLCNPVDKSGTPVFLAGPGKGAPRRSHRRRSAIPTITWSATRRDWRATPCRRAAAARPIPTPRV